MDKSSRIFTLPAANSQKSPISLAQMPTWQSGILQSSVHRTIKRLSDGFLERYGLSTMHWFVLGIIFEAGDVGIRLTELATKVGTTQSYLTNTLNILEHRGMVTRSDHPTDNRIKILTIPDTYRDTCAEIEAGLRDAFRQSIYRHLTRPELEAYINALQKLATI